MSNGAIGIGAGILETAGNVALGEQQYQQEQELMSIQHQNQQELNQQGVTAEKEAKVVKMDTKKKDSGAEPTNGTTDSK